MTNVSVEPANNGYIVTTHHSDGEDDVIVVEDRGGKQHMVQLLYTLLESLGELGSKQDSERIRVIIVDSDGKEIFPD